MTITERTAQTAAIAEPAKTIGLDEVRPRSIHVCGLWDLPGRDNHAIDRLPRRDRRRTRRSVYGDRT